MSAEIFGIVVLCGFLGGCMYYLYKDEELDRQNKDANDKYYYIQNKYKSNII